MTQDVLRDIGIVLAAALVSVPLAALLRVPLMVVLVGIGALIGPSALDLVANPLDGLGAQLVFTLGVSLILFHGGVGISLRVISQTAVGLGLLVLPGVALTACIVSVPAHAFLDVPWSQALMIGAVLASTDPAILIPLFERLRLRPKVAQTVIAESAFNDPTGTVLTLTLASVVTAGSVDLGAPAGDFAQSLALGAAIGIAGGLGLAALLSDHRFGFWRESPAAAILAVVAAQYFASEEIGGSGYLAAFVMGLVVGNMDLFRIRRPAHHFRVLEAFTGQAADVAMLAVFVTLGLNLPFDSLRDNLWAGLGVMAVFILVARPVTVLACLLPDRRGAWTREELVFLSWCRETGVVPAAVASLLLSRGVPGAEAAVTMVAFAIVSTLLLQATTAGAVARRLGLVEGSPEPLPAEVGSSPGGGSR
jgi:cell volume regulation protein A